MVLQLRVFIIINVAIESGIRMTFDVVCIEILLIVILFRSKETGANKLHYYTVYPENKY